MGTHSNTFADLLAKKKKPTATEEDALPVSGGRQTTAEGTSTIGNVLAELAMITPDFNIQLLGAMESLSIYNAEVSYAVDNIMQLGNTVGSFPTNITFDDGVADTQIKEMVALLKKKSKQWYKGGLNSLVNDLLSQIAVNGTLSAEAVPSNSLDGLRKIVTVSPKTIRFKYDIDQEDYFPYQHIAGKITPTGIKLNTFTYKYYPLRRVTEKPYGIPPFISSLENIQISRDMGENLKHVVKKLGILGFLEVLVNGPSAKNGESDKDYFKRTQNYLKSVTPQIEKGLSKGYVVGFEGSHKFNLQPTTGNVQGAKDLVEMNDVKLFAGLKQDPLMFGRNFSTTETLAQVILAKMTTQVGNYQKIVETFLEDVFLLELQLAGYAIENIEIEFEPPMITDGTKKQVARKALIENLKTEYNQGIISQEVVAQELGREAPDQEEPRPAPALAVNPNKPVDLEEEEPKGKEDVTKTKDKKENTKLLPWQVSLISEFSPTSSGYRIVDVYFNNDRAKENVVILNNEFLDTFDVLDVTSIVELENVSLEDVTQRYVNGLGGHLTEYEYESEGCNCGDHKVSTFAKKDETELEQFIRLYLIETKGRYSTAVEKAVKEIAISLAQLGEGATEKVVYDSIMYTLYKNWKVNFTIPQKKTVNKFVKNVYTYFRKDKSIFKNADGIPKGTFGTLDLRAIDYYKRVDNLYLGKFITDVDLKKKVTQYLKDEYLDGDLPIGNNKEAIAKFKSKFGNVLEEQEWKLSRIVNTTVNKMRNTASVSYMQEADVEQFEIVEVGDRLSCPYCIALNGKIFSVTKEVTRLKETVNSDPEYVGVDAPFVTSIFKKAEDMEGLTSDELQDKGIGLPPQHANCRGTIIAVL